MAEGETIAIEMESSTDPLMPKPVEGQGANNSPDAAPRVSVTDEEKPKEFLSRFNDIFDNTTSTEQKKADFETLLNGDDVKLKNNDVQKAFVIMFKDIAKYEEFLKLFINRFTAYNERIETKYLPKNNTNKNKTKKQRRPISNNDQNTMRDLDAPLHCAVRQLNEGFIVWLLGKTATEVNLRNKQKETALAILCQKYDCVPKLKTRLEDIEKEREKADKKQQIRLDAEKIEVSVQMKEMEEEMTMNAPTILNLIKMLLVKGADFNIYLNDGALPFDFLRNYYTKAVLDDIIKYPYVKSNVAMIEKPPEKSNTSAEGKNVSKKRIVKFYKKTEDMDVRVTEELLEIFICFKDLEKFKHYWEKFNVTGDNVKKVILLLLHVAVERNYKPYVDQIVAKASKDIFKLEENKVTDSDEPTQNETSAEALSRWRFFKCCQKRHCPYSKTYGEEIELRVITPNSQMQSETIKSQDNTPDSQDNHVATTEGTPTSHEKSSRWRCLKCFPKKQNPPPLDGTNPRAQRKNSKDCRLTKAEENKMVHRNELKGLLKMVCLNGNKALLTMFLDKMNDMPLVNDTPLLIFTIEQMSKAKKNQKFKNLQDCAITLINNHEKIRMQDTDPNKNTALHLALRHGHDKIASLLLNEGHGLMGLMNKQNLTPIEYGSTQFWNNYLDNCITYKKGNDLRFNVGFLKPRATNESSDTSKSSSSKGYSPSVASRILYWIWYCWVKRVEEMNATHNSKYRFTRIVNDMTALRLISQSKDRKEFLMHPVIIAFITMKWKRLCHWNILNLLLTTFTMGTFIAHTLMKCPSGGLKCFVTACVILEALILSVREIMQMFLLRLSYFKYGENYVDIINVVFIFKVLACGCDRDGWCEAVPSFSSFVFVSLALQATFLLGATCNNLSITLYMFKTVSSSFLKSFLSFTPVIVAFVCSFYMMNNEPSGISISNGTESNSFAENFNNFHSAWDAAIKTLVMTTGEFEAANINYDVGKRLLFVAFLFIAPIVILNLINGLAVSDIAAIRQESEFISVCKRVMLLERYERAVVNFRATMLTFLQRVFSDPWFPGSFFDSYESTIHVKTNELNKMLIQKKNKLGTSTSNNNGCSKDPASQSDSDKTNEHVKSNDLNKSSILKGNDQMGASTSKNNNGSKDTDSQSDSGKTDEHLKSNDLYKSSTLKEKDQMGASKSKNKNGSKDTDKRNELQPIPFFPIFPSTFLKYYVTIRSVEWVPYMTLDQCCVDKLKTIAKRHSKNSPSRGTQDPVDTEQTARKGKEKNSSVHQPANDVEVEGRQ